MLDLMLIQGYDASLHVFIVFCEFFSIGELSECKGGEEQSVTMCSGPWK